MVQVQTNKTSGENHVHATSVEQSNSSAAGAFINDSRTQTIAQRKYQFAANTSLRSHQLQEKNKLANSSSKRDPSVHNTRLVTQRAVIQREVSVEEKGQLTTLETQIDAALKNTILRKKTVVKFDIPGFVSDEYQIPRENIPHENHAGLILAGQRYLAMIGRINGLAAVVDFNRFVGTIGDTYQTYAADIDYINDQHKADVHTLFSGADPSDTRVSNIDARVKTLNGKVLAGEGKTFEDTISGGVVRNREAGEEVTSLHNMLSLMMLEVKKTTGIYKSPYDQGAGRLGAEWTVKAGTSSKYPKVKEKADSIAEDWVLHAHVSGVHGNRFSKKITAINADHFHLKDKATAGGGDGPSVVVNTADVKGPAETALTTYMETINDKNNQWRIWIGSEYIIAD